MNTDKILIYGERLSDLKDAQARMSTAATEPITADLVGAVAPFLRAMRRAQAEVLLEQADRGGLGFLDLSPDEQRVEASARILIQMVQVEANPFELHTHPALATGAVRCEQRSHV